MAVVTPWEVEGKIDYKKLLKEFGVSEIDGNIKNKLERKAGELHPLIKRDFYYAHRDLDKALEGDFFLYTGIAPSKSIMHIGHYASFEITRWLQEVFGANVYIMIPDEEKFLAKKADSLKKIEEYCEIVEKIIASMGFDEDKTFIFRDREFIGRLYNAAIVVARKVNYSVARAVFGFSGETSIGLVFYPALQIVPTLFEKKQCLIPCAIDQDPYWRIQRDIAESLGFRKTATILSKFVPGLLGPEGKMSASDVESTIYITDSEDEMKKKIMNAFTGGQPTAKEQREKGGNPEICTVFEWHRIFNWEDDFEEIYEKCKRGEIVCGECKEMLFKSLKRRLENIKKKMKTAEKSVEKMKYDGELASKMWDWSFEVP